MKAVIIHGPNLNLLGTRELSVYGTSTLAEVDDAIQQAAREIGCEVESHQSAHEGEIIDLLHGAIDRVDGALLNPAAYSHTSRAIADAIRAVPFPVVEVHLSNIHAREPWRRSSVTAEAASGIVAGFGIGSYVAALHALKRLVGA
ncbi:MAG: type II 3-dehydroquinate dehydratase [Actinomycetota bacterium]|nr:type II 3-dehydroquinate dehydratase [Actinomycetota bacterium]